MVTVSSSSGGGVTTNTSQPFGASFRALNMKRGNQNYESCLVGQIEGKQSDPKKDVCCEEGGKKIKYILFQKLSKFNSIDWSKKVYIKSKIVDQKMER